MEKVFILFTEDMYDGDERRHIKVFKTLESAKKELRHFYEETLKAVSDEDLDMYCIDEFTDETTSWEMYLDGAWYEDHSIAYIEESQVED